MCGICGSVSFSPSQPPDGLALEAMCESMRHRGPDDEGYYLDRYAGLGMRRLSIIDLATGRQPIANEEGSLQVVFNGELYNYRQLRRQLEQRGHRFATASDTEVIAHAYEEYGERCVEQFNGIFAFAVWDSRARRLMLARDHLGIKPLYYWLGPGQIVFGSELKALLANQAVPRTIDPTAIDLFLTLEYIPAPHTILRGVSKLLPGHRLIFDPERLRIEQYWDVPQRQVPASEEACAEALAELIGDAVRAQMVSDVPLGAFLSGGIDSSSVVSFMSEASAAPLRTFSIGFEEASYNELPYARMVAQRYGTLHEEAVLRPDVAALAQRLIAHLDEPLGDFSILPTFLVSELASRSVKVVLSGDGGDELFAGYDSYVAQSYDRLYSRLPAPLRQRALPALLDRVPPRPEKKGLVNKAKRFVEGAAQPQELQHTRWMRFLSSAEKASLYHQELRSALSGDPAAALLGGYFSLAPGGDELARQQYVDVKTYLADDILAKVDRMSMAASVEARVPLLDHRIVEFALSLPAAMKLRGGKTKRILRRAVAGRLPAAVLSQPKRGFSIPLKSWLCSPLRPMMIDLLSADHLRKRGLFRPQCVERWMEEHLRGAANHSHRLWALMVLELWQQTTLDSSREPTFARPPLAYTG
jgi:asparagine synthase (glutamine-hydrolysing)